MESKELKHFIINGRYGGSQEWMLDPWLRLGGCGALAAVDTCIYYSLLPKDGGRIKLVRDPDKLDKKKYRMLASEMKPYLRPRAGGIDRLEIFMDGFGNFLRDKKASQLSMTGYPMGGSVDDAWTVFRNQIDSNILVPVLLLNPVSKEWEEFHWHWFLLNGYRSCGEERLVKAVTYGEYKWLHWDTFWDAHDKTTGGMILYSSAE